MLMGRMVAGAPVLMGGSFMSGLAGGMSSSSAGGASSSR